MWVSQRSTIARQAAQRDRSREHSMPTGAAPKLHRTRSEVITRLLHGLVETRCPSFPLDEHARRKRRSSSAIMEATLPPGPEPRGPPTPGPEAPRRSGANGPSFTAQSINSRRVDRSRAQAMTEEWRTKLRPSGPADCVGRRRGSANAICRTVLVCMDPAQAIWIAVSPVRVGGFALEIRVAQPEDVVRLKRVGEVIRTILSPRDPTTAQDHVIGAADVDAGLACSSIAGYAWSGGCPTNRHGSSSIGRVSRQRVEYDVRDAAFPTTADANAVLRAPGDILHAHAANPAQFRLRRARDGCKRTASPDPTTDPHDSTR